MSLRVRSRLCSSELWAEMAFFAFSSVDYRSVYLKAFTYTYISGPGYYGKTDTEHLLSILWVNESHALWWSFFGSVSLNGFQKCCVWFVCKLSYLNVAAAIWIGYGSDSSLGPVVF